MPHLVCKIVKRRNWNLYALAFYHIRDIENYNGIRYFLLYR